MLHPDLRAASDLQWFYEEAEALIKRDVRSIQAGTEAELEKRRYQQPHRPLIVRAPAGWSNDRRTGRALWEDDGLRCGLVEVGAGDDGQPATQPDMDIVALKAAMRESRIRHALTGARWPTSEDWSPPQDVAPEVVLQLRFREPMRVMGGFGQEIIPRAPFGLAGSAARRGRPERAPVGYRLTPLRGAGNLAHLTDSALHAWRAARTRIDCGRWTDRLGARLAQGKAADGEERALGQQIARDCLLLETHALAAYRRALVRVPEQVRRAALARAG